MKYSKEFKEEALKLSDEIGVKKAATQLGLHYYTLAEWRKNRKSKAEASKLNMSDDEIRARISRLERENAELTRANEILKDALGFFAKDRKK
ncbi:MAG: Transposase [Firmicutes bacterium ADurb.Bin300]|jgi:transposase|nr:MAG: Transposase [Firmicutes bacterium ADurb.Bin300]